MEDVKSKYQLFGAVVILGFKLQNGVGCFYSYGREGVGGEGVERVLGGGFLELGNRWMLQEGNQYLFVFVMCFDVILIKFVELSGIYCR